MNKIISQLSFIIRKTINQSLYQYDYIIGRRTNIFILSYHSFADDAWHYSTSLSELEKQILYLQESGYQWLALKDLPRYLRNSEQKPSVIFTIDDGYVNVLNSLPLFTKYKITPTLFVLGDAVHANRKEMANNNLLLSFAQIRKLQRSGWEIGSHSATHANLLNLSQNELKKEIINSKITIEKNLGKKVISFAYPRGKYSIKDNRTQSVLNIVKTAGYTFGLTMDDGIISNKIQLLNLPRIGINNSHTISEFKTLFSPSVIMFRQIVKNSLLERYI